jgi:hypothetical protein
MPRDFTVASTTDTQQVVDQVAGVEHTEEVDESKQSAEPKPEEKSGVPAEEAKKEDKGAVHDEKTFVEPKNGYERRINKLTARNYAAENEKSAALEENRLLKERLDALEAKIDGKAAAKTEKSADPVLEEKEPIPGDFDKYEDYVKASVRFGARAVARELFNEQKKEQEAQATELQVKETEDAQRAMFDAYNQRVSEARGQLEDFDEVVSAANSDIPDSAKFAIIEQENGPEIVYHLAKNPELCEELVALRMRPLAVAAKIGKLAAKLAKASANDGPTKTGALEKKTVVTKAPEPIKTVSGTGTRTEIPIDELSYQDYAKTRRGK